MNNNSLLCNQILAKLLKPNIGTIHVQQIQKNFEFVAKDINYKVAITFVNFNIDIFIATNKSVPCDNLRDMFLFVYELNMLFLGYFPEVESINITDSNVHNSKELEDKSKNVHRSLLGCYKSYSELKKNCVCLIDIDSFDYSQSFPQWVKFRNDYDLQHRLYLYTSSSIDLLIDLRLALLCQVFEPMFHHFCNREKPKIFKDILQELILLRGTDIFKAEIENKTLLSIVDKIKLNRNQLFHVEKKGNVPSSSECLYFFHKLNLLYRHSLICSLGIDFDIYSSKTINLINAIENSFKGSS